MGILICLRMFSVVPVTTLPYKKKKFHAFSLIYTHRHKIPKYIKTLTLEPVSVLLTVLLLFTCVYLCVINRNHNSNGMFVFFII